MIRFPLWPTLLVAASIAAMANLGFWQLDRRAQKEEAIARYQAASRLPPVAWPNVPPEGDDLLYRRATGFCLEVIGWRAVAGRNRLGETGWSHVASCRTGAEGPGMQAVMGWSKSASPPSGWTGGEVSGVIAPDRAHRIRLVASDPPPGLQAVAPPVPATSSRSHLFYAIQWFAFAAIAALIYVLALRRRQQPGASTLPPPPRDPRSGGS